MPDTPTLTEPPEAPGITDVRDVFSEKAIAFLLWMITHRDELDAANEWLIEILDSVEATAAAAFLPDAISPSDADKFFRVNGAGTGFTFFASALLADFIGLSPSEGDILYHDGTNLVPLEKGTAGQVLTQNSGETAPEWGTPQGLVHLGTFTESGGELIVSGIPEVGSAADEYLEIFLSIQYMDVTSDSTILMTISQDSGATYQSTGYKWVNNGRDSGGTARTGNSNSDSSWRLTPTSVDALSNNALTGRIYLTNGTLYARAQGFVGYGDPSGNFAFSDFHGTLTPGSSIDSLKFTGGTGSGGIGFAVVHMFGLRGN